MAQKTSERHILHLVQIRILRDRSSMMRLLGGDRGGGGGGCLDRQYQQMSFLDLAHLTTVVTLQKVAFRLLLPRARRGFIAGGFSLQHEPSTLPVESPSWISSDSAVDVGDIRSCSWNSASGFSDMFPSLLGPVTDSICLF